jgi:hypothetical protein
MANMAGLSKFHPLPTFKQVNSVECTGQLAEQFRDRTAHLATETDVIGIHHRYTYPAAAIA